MAEIIEITLSDIAKIEGVYKLTLSGNMYNMVHGVEPTCEITLSALALDPSKMARFRDAYITYRDETKQAPVLVIMTRTGGSNRRDYQEFNEAMTQLPGFIDDRDDEFDRTFALFRFVPPANIRETAMRFLDKAGSPKTLREKTFGVVGDMDAGTMSTATKIRVDRLIGELSKGLGLDGKK